MPITREALDSLPGGMSLGIYDVHGKKWTVLYRDIKNRRVVVCLKPPSDSGHCSEMNVSYSSGKIRMCLLGPDSFELSDEIEELCAEACYTDSVPEPIATYIRRWKIEAQKISFRG